MRACIARRNRPDYAPDQQRQRGIFAVETCQRHVYICVGTPPGCNTRHCELPAPGVVATNLLPGWLRILNPLLGHVIDPEAGARSSVYLALSSEAARTNGCYFDECHTQRRASHVARRCRVTRGALEYE